MAYSPPLPPFALFLAGLCMSFTIDFILNQRLFFMHLLIRSGANHKSQNQTLYWRYTTRFSQSLWIFFIFFSFLQSLCCCCLCSVKMHITSFSFSAEHISSHCQRCLFCFFFTLFLFVLIMLKESCAGFYLNLSLRCRDMSARSRS